ncbi:hypothetical protein [uncultured Spongiibacter sp.]|uniref:hypothetical protein n=1 Tax=Spongiibacter marinus TaxID=354246 RepID=UPI002587E3C6|nr:hypothetical protein [uncultured Spongiibacter sp.]
MNNWIAGLSETELKYMAPALFIYEDDPEDAAIFMYQEGLSKPMAAAGDKDIFIARAKLEKESRPPKSYWEQVKHEIFTLICTGDSKYDQLRKSLEEVSEQGTKVIVATVAASVASIMGVEAGIISGFCAVVLHFIIKVGKESYCALKQQST